MNRPILSLWPCLWRALLPLTVAAVLTVLSIVSFGLGAAAAVIVALWAWQYIWLWEFAQRVRGFSTITDGWIVLHYEPGLERTRNLRRLLRECHVDLARLSGQFRFTLRRPPAIYLFRNWRDISKLFGPQYGGVALNEAMAIVVANDNSLSESVRHELVHLYAARWGLAPPPILEEGLAVWLQETEQGEAIDAAALPWVCEARLKLRSLLKREFFFSDTHRHACYIFFGW